MRLLSECVSCHLALLMWLRVAGFTAADLDRFLVAAVPLSVWLGALSLAWHILTTIVGAIVYERGSLRKLYSLVGCVVFGTVAMLMFAISLVSQTRR